MVTWCSKSVINGSKYEYFKMHIVSTSSKYKRCLGYPVKVQTPPYHVVFTDDHLGT